MSDIRILYRYSLLEAKCNNEVDLWRDSQKANIACRKAIEQAIADHFDGFHLQKDTAKLLIDGWGYDRLNWVLANTIQHNVNDGRYSSANKEWANSFVIPTGTANDYTFDYVVNSHPGVVDCLVTQARREYANLQLFDKTNCEDNCLNLDFEGKVLVLKPEILLDAYKTPDDQLFFASSGFGCAPTSRGRKVFGHFLKDGEKTYYNRADFIGVLKDEYLPDWAREKLLDPSDEQQDCLSME